MSIRVGFLKGHISREGQEYKAGDVGVIDRTFFSSLYEQKIVVPFSEFKEKLKPQPEKLISSKGKKSKKVS